MICIIVIVFGFAPLKEDPEDPEDTEVRDGRHPATGGIAETDRELIVVLAEVTVVVGVNPEPEEIVVTGEVEVDNEVVVFEDEDDDEVVVIGEDDVVEDVDEVVELEDATICVDINSSTLSSPSNISTEV